LKAGTQKFSDDTRESAMSKADLKGKVLPITPNEGKSSA